MRVTYVVGGCACAPRAVFPVFRLFRYIRRMIAAKASAPKALPRANDVKSDIWPPSLYVATREKKPGTNGNRSERPPTVDLPVDDAVE